VEEGTGTTMRRSKKEEKEKGVGFLKLCLHRKPLRKISV